MGDIIETENGLTVIVDEKYFRTVVTNPMDDFFIGTINYLSDQGKSCQFLGFNVFNGHVVLIDGIKYCTKGTKVFADWGIHRENFLLVEDLDHDYREDRFNNRVKVILDILGGACCTDE